MPGLLRTKERVPEPGPQRPQGQACTQIFLQDKAREGSTFKDQVRDDCGKKTGQGPRRDKTQSKAGQGRSESSAESQSRAEGGRKTQIIRSQGEDYFQSQGGGENARAQSQSRSKAES
ncbi:MAG TPA: hypothetical protein VGN05_01415 [Parvibaculum sp.]